MLLTGRLTFIALVIGFSAACLVGQDFQSNCDFQNHCQYQVCPQNSCQSPCTWPVVERPVLEPFSQVTLPSPQHIAPAKPAAKKRVQRKPVGDVRIEVVTKQSDTAEKSKETDAKVESTEATLIADTVLRPSSPRSLHHDIEISPVDHLLSKTMVEKRVDNHLEQDDSSAPISRLADQEISITSEFDLEFESENEFHETELSAENTVFENQLNEFANHDEDSSLDSTAASAFLGETPGAGSIFPQFSHNARFFGPFLGLPHEFGVNPTVQDVVTEVVEDSHVEEATAVVLAVNEAPIVEAHAETNDAMAAQEVVRTVSNTKSQRRASKAGGWWWWLPLLALPLLGWLALRKLGRRDQDVFGPELNESSASIQQAQYVAALSQQASERTRLRREQLAAEGGVSSSLKPGAVSKDQPNLQTSKLGGYGKACEGSKNTPECERTSASKEVITAGSSMPISCETTSNTCDDHSALKSEALSGDCGKASVASSFAGTTGARTTGARTTGAGTTGAEKAAVIGVEGRPKKQRSGETQANVGSAKRRTKCDSHSGAVGTTSFSATEDDFTTIDGIGSDVQQALYASGFRRFSDLKEADSIQLKQILSQANCRMDSSALKIAANEAMEIGPVGHDVVRTQSSASLGQLTRIRGIGPATAKLLYDAGIHNFTDLRSTSHEGLKQILTSGGSKFQLIDPSSWSKQAEFAVNEDWEGLKKWQFLNDVSSDGTQCSITTGNTNENERSSSRVVGPAKDNAHATNGNCELSTGDSFATGEGQQLTRIRGIGPATAKLLYDAGICNFTDLRSTSQEGLQQILTNGGSKFQLIDPSSWSKQAEFATNEDWDGLAKWQFLNEVSSEGSSSIVRDANKNDLVRRSGSKDELTLIKGIGPATEKILHANGIFGFGQIASMTGEQIVQLFEKADANFQLVEPMTWKDQATKLASTHGTAADDEIELTLLDEIEAIGKIPSSLTDESEVEEKVQS